MLSYYITSLNYHTVMNIAIRALEQRVDSLSFFLHSGLEPSGTFSVPDNFKDVKYTAILTVTNEKSTFDDGDIWFGSGSIMYYKPVTSIHTYEIPFKDALYSMVLSKMQAKYNTLDINGQGKFERKRHQGLLRNCALTGCIEPNRFTLNKIEVDDSSFQFNCNLSEKD